MNQINDFVQQHAVASMAAVHLAHLAWGRVKACWPGIRAAYLYCRANGGARGVLNEFLNGIPGQNSTANQNKETK